MLYVYSGGFRSGRGLGLIAEAFVALEVKHHVLFIGYGPLKTKLDECSRRCNRIHVLDAVPVGEVLAYLAGGDVGLSLIKDVCLSYRHCLPNKLFEYLLAGIPVMVSDLPDQRTLVEEHGGGWVVELALSQLVGHLSTIKRADVDVVKEGLLKRTESLSWETEREILLELYSTL